MNRCLIPGILALGIHGLLFAMEFNWATGESFFHPKTPVVTMTLTYLQPRSKPALQKTTPAPPKVVKKVKIPTQAPKPDFILRSKPKLEPITIKTPQPELRPEKIKIRFEQEPVQIPVEAPEQFTPVVLITSAVPQSKAPPAPMIRKAKPLYRHNPPPRYPRFARKRKYQGVVILKVFVNRDGRVGDAKVFKSSGYAILDKSAMKSVKKWEFEPGMRGDDKMEMWVRIPVRFQLK